MFDVILLSVLKREFSDQHSCQSESTLSQIYTMFNELNLSFCIEDTCSVSQWMVPQILFFLAICQIRSSEVLSKLVPNHELTFFLDYPSLCNTDQWPFAFCEDPIY